MRKILYFLLAVLAVASVLIKAKQIEQKEVSEIVSINEEWKKTGKPVDAALVIRTDMYEIEKVSGKMMENGYIYAQLPRETAGKLFRGQQFKVLNGAGIEGRIVSVSRTPDMLTGMYNLTLKVTSGELSPGVIIVAGVRTKSHPDTLAVKKEAVLRDDAGSFCWVISPENIVAKRRISTGKEYEGYLMIEEGLEEDEKVCTDGLARLRENDFVSIRKEGR